MKNLRTDTKKNYRLLKWLILASFLFIFGTTMAGFFIQADFYTKGWGTVVGTTQIMVVSQYNGILAKVNVRSEQQIKKDTVIANVIEDGKNFAIVAPKTGEFLKIGDEDLTVGKTVDKYQICGMIIRNGSFFEILVGEQDILDVKEGQKCIFRITAFEHENYPPIYGNVFYVSDLPTIQDYKNYYTVICTFDGTSPLEKRTRVGMSGTAEILVGKETVFNLLMGRRKREEN